MRTLNADLTAAQKAPSRTPYLRVIVQDRIANLPRLTYTRLYTGTEPDKYHANCIPGDGSLCRAYTDGTTVKYQRVANPDENSNYSVWTDLVTTTVPGNRPVALCASGSRVLIFYCNNDNAVSVKESTDYGATFGAATALNTVVAGQIPQSIGAAVKSNGDVTVFVGLGNSTLYKKRRTAGVWEGAWVNSGLSFDSAPHVGVLYNGDWNLVLTTNTRVYTAIYGDGFNQASNTFSSLKEMTRSDNTSLTFHQPYIALVDEHRVTFIENHTATVTYTRPYFTHSPPGNDYTANAWREPYPFNLAASVRGLAIAAYQNRAWLSTPSGVWRSNLPATDLDVTADVLEAITVERPFVGRLRLVLDNSKGTYSQGSLPAVLKLGAEIRFSPGYQTASGPLVSSGPAYWIDNLEWQTARGRGRNDQRSVLVITAHDGWGLLQRWKARRQFSFAGQSVDAIITFLAGRAGLGKGSLSQSSVITTYQPPFTVGPDPDQEGPGEDVPEPPEAIPGDRHVPTPSAPLLPPPYRGRRRETGVRALRRALAYVPDVAYFHGETLRLLNPQSTDASVYSYGGQGEHPLLAGRYGQPFPRANRVQVTGGLSGSLPLFDETFDWTSIDQLYDLLKQVHDTNMTTAAQLADRLNAEKRELDMESVTGEIIVPVNAGQELYDVITVTDPAAGLTNAKRRVVGQSLRYSRAEDGAVYEHRLLLGAV